jgi:hypothetical protein
MLASKPMVLGQVIGKEEDWVFKPVASSLIAVSEDTDKILKCLDKYLRKFVSNDLYDFKSMELITAALPTYSVIMHLESKGTQIAFVLSQPNDEGSMMFGEVLTAENNEEDIQAYYEIYHAIKQTYGKYNTLADFKEALD